MAQTSHGVATDKPAATKTSEAVVAKRDAPVPEASSPDERVAFIRAGSVWIMQPDGSDAAQLSVRPHDAPDEAPALSPRGDAIAYASVQGGVSKLFVVSLEELVPQELTDGRGGGDRNPTWSPDGKRIAFTRGDPRDRCDVYSVEVGTNAPPTLLIAGKDDHPDRAGQPAWSPDGEHIVFASDRRKGRGTTLWLVALDSKLVQQVTVTRPGAIFVRDQNPTWSPDGKRIAFSSNRHVSSGDDADQFDIYAVNPDGSGLTRLSDDPAAATDPTYSADGARLYFVSSRGQQNPYEMELYVMAAEGGQQRRMTRDERPQNRAPSAGLAK